MVSFQLLGKVVNEKRTIKYHENFSKSNEGRVARAVSLCLYNKIHMAQLYWPETAPIGRHSVSQLEGYRRSSSANVIRMSHRKSEEIYRESEPNEQTTKLLEASSARHLEPAGFDGLVTLDENRLDTMVETDLVSSN